MTHKLVALVARRQASLDAVRTKLPGVQGWTRLQQAVTESTAEAWVVACTTAEHVPIVRTLLEAGIFECDLNVHCPSR